MTRVERAVLWGLTILAILPLWSARYLPFTDLPEHVAAEATVAHLIARTGPDPDLYEIAFGRCQYLLYHGLGGLLTLATGDAILANKVLLSIVAVAFPLSLRAALRAFRRDEALAVFAIAPFLSRPLIIGFLPFVASIPLFFAGIALVRGPRTRGRTMLVAAWPILLLFTHASTTALFLVSVVLLELLEAARVTSTPRGWLVLGVQRSLWALPGMIGLGMWWAFGRITLRADTLAGPGEIGTMGLVRSLRALPLWSFDLFNTHLDELCGGAWWVALCIGAFVAARPERADDGHMHGLAARIDPAFVPLFVLCLAFLVTPFRVGAGGMLNVRLAPLIALATTLTVGRSPAKIRPWLLGSVVLVTVLHCGNAVRAIRIIATREVAGLDEVLDAMRPGTSVVSLQFDTRLSLAHVDPYPFVASYHRTRGGGLASYSFSELAHWPLQYRPGRAPPSKPGLWVYHPCTYRNDVDGAAYDYVLVGGAIDPFRGEPSGPAWRELRRSGSFTLYGRDGDRRWTGADLGPCARVDPAMPARDIP